MRIQSSHSNSDRCLDPYFTPSEATWSLLAIEPNIPHSIWEPAAGDGAISDIFKKDGFNVYATDIADYGNATVHSGFDYLKMDPDPLSRAVITNPPFKLAQSFAEKAISESLYVALLLRTNFLESIERLQFFRQHPPTKIWISSRRLPMMHRFNWTGPIAPSNTCHAWFIWDHSRSPEPIGWFDWKEHSRIESPNPTCTAEELGL